MKRLQGVFLSWVVSFGLGVSNMQAEFTSGQIFPMVEISFQLPQMSEHPFDEILFGRIGEQWIPAFYDGDGVWRLRFSPMYTGHYEVSIYSEKERIRSRQAVKGLVPKIVEVEGEPLKQGWVRLNPDYPQTFLRGNKDAYYPVGMNIGWDMGEQGSVVDFLERLAAVDGNWTRIWMCHWDDKDLTWPQGKKIALGEIDLTAARKWDQILETATRLHVPFQMVLQHHGQFSSDVDSQWKENPWNKRNGGFLERAEDFFSNELARKFTRQKYRYVVARYGWSPAIMAWELFNEVEFTDAAKTEEGRRAILEWHEEMAAFIRSLDPNAHLITTSALALDSPVWSVTDFYQQHLYPPDPLAGSGGFSVEPAALSRPIFYGEIGSVDAGGQTPGQAGEVLKKILWGGIFACAGATAQYWAWDQVDREKAYPVLQSMTAFAKMAGLGEGRWRRLRASIWTTDRADLVFGPGQRWDSVVDPHLVLKRDGSNRPQGVAFSSTLRPRRGSGEREGTDRITFEVQTPSGLEIQLEEVSRDGATLQVYANGKLLKERVWDPLASGIERQGMPETVVIDFPENTTHVELRSAGKDYLRISCLRWKNYVPELGVMAMSNDRHSVLWIFQQAALKKDKTVTGWVKVEGLLPGSYEAIWWDTQRASIIATKTLQTESTISLQIPIFENDVALLLKRAEE